MKTVKKAFVLLVAILAIVVFTVNVNAAAIPTNKTNNNTANNVTNNAVNTTENEVEPSEEPSPSPVVNNAYQPINTSNASENIPNTGIDSAYLNFALILLLTLVLGTFSLVQYNKIIKKDQE